MKHLLLLLGLVAMSANAQETVFVEVPVPAVVYETPVVYQSSVVYQAPVVYNAPVVYMTPPAVQTYSDVVYAPVDPNVIIVGGHCGTRAMYTSWETSPTVIYFGGRESCRGRVSTRR